ncbi:E3 ubiquitin-protein ligase [Melia azedarach]|uniref:E3 ubiquitin-protein ligase n=1 Tax=Melia azedarach TaxID=155640 RepID=A0ACC1X7P2_MELAZ|nr:E3 ubiquitin-protein ligase [Melia azedarach]
MKNVEKRTVKNLKKTTVNNRKKMKPKKNQKLIIKRSELMESPQGKGRISMTLGDPEVLDCPICFELLTIPVLQHTPSQWKGTNTHTLNQDGESH